MVSDFSDLGLGFKGSSLEGARPGGHETQVAPSPLTAWGLGFAVHLLYRLYRPLEGEVRFSCTA